MSIHRVTAADYAALDRDDRPWPYFSTVTIDNGTRALTLQSLPYPVPQRDGRIRLDYCVLRFVGPGYAEWYADSEWVDADQTLTIDDGQE